MKVGFIGLGIMGKPMSKNLLKAGYELVVFDFNKDAVGEVVACGAAAVNSGKEVAKQCEVIITMVPNSPHVRAAVLGENGVADGAKPGTVVIDMSSIDPTESKAIGAELAKKGMAPENKVTPELASKKSLGLHPIVIGVDECQVWFEHPDYGEELEATCTDLVKRGPALGIILILATQRPDAKSLPTGISANVSTRFCLKVQGQTENDMVLGTSKYKQGVRATTFAWEDKGIGYLVGEGSDAQIVRTVAGLDGPASEKVAAYARRLREQAGTLSGHAIGEQLQSEQDTRRDTLLEDILTVVPETEKKVWNERVIARLYELRPDAYETYREAADLTAALKRHGIRTGQVWGTTDDGKGASRIGITRADIAKTVAERNREDGAA